ncbi:hypothetical protein [Leptospira borgpetersenii]|uniref:hypothetical protein n=1 Tax=Leptospira borgpetersenii TaxID=174 RepID=UPI0009B5ADDE|nr:hypothetical protein B9T54_15900 [Leptospira borgpetersenii serovar Hardjo-bovis]
MCHFVVIKFASDSPNFLTSSSPKNLSQNLKKNISKRSGKFLKNARVPTETVVLKVFPVV